MKKQLILSLIYLISFSTVGLSCCAERNYRLLPLGQVKNDFIFLELDLFRHCNKNEGGGIGNEFWFAGTVSIVKYKDDVLLPLKELGKFDTLDCVCNYRNHYQLSTFDTIIESFYNKALTYTKQLKNYNPIVTGSIQFNDTINTVVTTTETDSTYETVVKYRNIFEYDINNEEISSCYPKIVAEVRSYHGKKQNLKIIRLRCRLLSKEAIVANNKRFKNIETAFWKEETQWHGIAKDYLIIEAK
ncbi:MAG: hypothetical protein AB8B74_10580 [Crocinitomicaceae bacterium]